MKKFYFLSLLMLLTVFCSLCSAQEAAFNGTITGRVLDEKQAPVDLATIGLYRLTDSSLVKNLITTDDGKFQFENVQVGRYYLYINRMGFSRYKSEIININAQQPQVEIAKINLAGEGTMLRTVNITAVKPLLERKADKLVMNVENSSIAIGSTALEVLQQAPGITVDHNDNISMQGKQGVNVMLDGKLTHMSNADVANLLRNMPSSQIETIELIANPSSKYDASGNAGIINIRTKKSKNGGTNGSVTSTLAHGNNFRGNFGVNLNHRVDKVNVFGNYNYGYFQNGNLLDIDRIANGSPNTYFDQRSDNYRERNNNNFKAGVDYFINPKNTLGLLVTGYLNKGTEQSESKTLIGKSFGQIDSLLNARSKQNDRYRNLAYNLNYKSILDSAGSEISADLDYSSYYGRDVADYENEYLYLNGSSMRPVNITRNTTPNRINIKAAKVDYNVALSKSLKLEVGLKSSWVTTDNDLRAEEYAGNIWKNDPRRSNQFIYDENVNAAYTSLNKQFKSTSVQLGLRMEHTKSTGNLITTNNVVNRSYVDFFPTLFIQQNISKSNQIGFSYSRRINRPGYDDLNPFVYYLDQYTYNKGNPFLKPQYTNNFEVSYTLMQKYLLSVNYSLVNDVITQVLLPDQELKALYQTNVNLAENVSYGANLNVPVKFAKWWNVNTNINVFYLSFKSPNLGGQMLENGKTAMQLKMQHAFTFGKGISAELNGSYESPLDYGTLHIGNRYYVDMGISKSLMDKKASLKIALSDVFNTNDQNISSAYPGLKYSLYQKNDTQLARLSFTYRFGKNEIKPARRRTTATETEQGRMRN